MALITIIIGLLFDRAFRHLHDLRELSWFEYYTTAVTRVVRGNGLAQIIAVLIVPVAVIALIQFLLSDFLLQLPYLIFGVLVFAYCLGPACLSSDIEFYLDARRLGDTVCCQRTYLRRHLLVRNCWTRWCIAVSTDDEPEQTGWHR